jgi:hypothetical protein
MWFATLLSTLLHSSAICGGYGCTGDLDVLLEFLTNELPSIEELALYDYNLLEYQQKRSFSAGCFPRLHILHLLRCTLHPDILREPVAESTVQLVQIEHSAEGCYKDCMTVLSDSRIPVRRHVYSATCRGEAGLE